MKWKIFLLSNILLTFCIIFVVNTNISKAYKIEDFITQTEIIKNMNISNAYTTCANYVLNSADRLRQATNINQYSSYLIQDVNSALNNNNSYIEIWAFSNTPSLTFENNGIYQTMRFNTSLTYRIYLISKNTGNVTRDTTGNKNNIQSNNGYGLIQHTNTNVNWMGYYNNIYIGISPVEYPNYTPKIPFTIGYATIGQNYINCYFELWRNNQKVETNLIEYDSTTNSGVSRTIQLNSKVTNNKEYTLKAYNNGQFIIESSPFLIKFSEELQPGTITNESRRYNWTN